jgi:hypothetical protein
VLQLHRAPQVYRTIFIHDNLNNCEFAIQTKRRRLEQKYPFIAALTANELSDPIIQTLFIAPIDAVYGGGGVMNAEKSHQS